MNSKNHLITKFLAANIILLAYGFECGWISPTTKILQSENSPTGYPVSDLSLSWIASSVSMAAIFGVSIYSYIVDRFGRKIGLIFVAIPEAVSIIFSYKFSCNFVSAFLSLSGQKLVYTKFY